MKEKVTEFIKGAVLALLYIAIFVGVQTLLSLAGTYTAVEMGYDPYDSLVNITGPISLFTSLISVCLLWGIYYIRGIRLKSVILTKSITIPDFACAFVMAIGMRVLTNVYMNWAEEISFLKESIESAQESMNLDAATPYGAIVMVFAICVVAPVFEEILFRGFIQSELKRAGGVIFAVTVQGALFALAHLNLAQVIFTFVIGVILGFIYHKTRSIGITILIHMVFNCSVILELKDSEYTLIAVIFGILMVLLSLTLMLVLHRRRTEENI